MVKTTKKGKRFVKVAGAIVLSVATLFGAISASSDEKSGKISNESQVETIANYLDCDLSYMKFNQTKGVVRMMHNGDEPVYVHIADEMNKEENQLIQESLDYVFGIVGNINDNYKYEIVDKEEYEAQKKSHKTTILYKEGACDTGKVDSTGQISRNMGNLDPFGQNNYYSTYVIEFDREQSKSQSLDEKLYTFLHELLHAFGLDDVYVQGPNKTTDIYYNNTFMKGYSGGGNIITPNDLKCLFSAYAKQMSKEQLKTFIFKAQNITDRYESYYYENRVEKIKEYEKNKIESIADENIKSQFSSTLTDLDGTIINQKINIQIEGDKYTLSVSGAGRENKCIASGDVVEIDGIKILKNVKFTGTFELSDINKANSTIMDLYLVRLENRDMLYDVATMASMWGKDLLEVTNEINK